MIIAVKSINEMNDMFSDVKPMDFSGMGLMEATYHCQEMINESWEELKFSIMSEEYKYLYENGTEMIYEEDSFADKAKGAMGNAKNAMAGAKAAAGEKLSNVTDKIVALVKKFIAMVSGLVNKAVSNIRAHAISVSSKAAGGKKMSKNDFVAKANELVWNDRIEDRCKYGFTVDPFKLGSEANRMIVSFDTDISEVKSAQDVVKELTREFTNDDAKYFAPERVYDCVYNGFKEIGKGILGLKKDADKKANEAIKTAKAASSDKLSVLMERYKKAQKANINTISGMLSVWNIYARQCTLLVKVVKAVDKISKQSDPDKSNKVAFKQGKALGKRTDKVDDKNDRAINGKKLFREKKARAAAGQE